MTVKTGGTLLNPGASQSYAQQIRGIDLSSGDPAARNTYLPTFTKYVGNPIAAVASSSLTSMEWPWILRVDDIFPAGHGPYGESYRIYNGTDHSNSSTLSGIELWTATNPLGPWTNRGKVFVDSTGGNQTESPSIIYVPELTTFYMYYHQVGATGAASGEVTKLATMSLAQAETSDSWTIVSTPTNGIVVDVPIDGAGFWPNPSGYGYMHPWRFGQDWFAHMLIAGNPSPYFGLCRSRDGLNWSIDARPIMFQANRMQDQQGRFNQTSHYIAWDTGTVIIWKGVKIWVGVVFAYVGGGGNPTYSFYGMAPISDDFRRLLSTPTVLFNSLQSWETSVAGAPAGMGDNRAGGSLCISTQGQLILCYQGTGQLDPNTGATATVGAFGIAVGS